VAVHEALPAIACLDLAGGFTLNCPTNNALQAKCGRITVTPLPGAGDTGIAVGAAVAILDFIGERIHRQVDARGTVAAFPPSSLAHGVATAEQLAQVERVDGAAADVPAFIAAKLADGKVLCVNRGRSEVGPRALGHRSIIAHAAIDGIRDRINAAKGREPWRPLAPICRVEDYHDHFDGDTAMGRYMLFTCRVLHDGIPAVTHVDGTARVQCVDAQDAWLHPALGRLKAAGHAPVIVNTSFNCAGEPLVETLGDAIASFCRMGFDFLVTEGGVYRRRVP
jgi:carbamoyltransferase